MASEAEQMQQMQAMMAQMQQSNGGVPGPGPGPGPGGNGGGHRKRQSNASLSILDLQAKQMEVDPMTEIQDYHAEKELLLKAYDDIDLDENGDIEWSEFDQGMQRLNVSLTDAEVKQVFTLMDSDSSNFVDRNEFTMFLSQRFESTELTRYQDAILRKVGGRSRKSGVAVGMGDEIGDVAIAAMEREMRKELNNINNAEMVILKEEEKMYLDLEKQEEEQEDFGCVDRANDWNRFEVAHWIDVEVKLSEYMTTFMKAHVDGSILLSDLGENYLVSEMGIKRVHVAKIMRAIVELRDKIRTEWDECEPWDIISYPNQYLNDERGTDIIAHLRGELSARDAEIVSLKKEYESRIQHLLAEIGEKEGIIKQAEEDGFILDDDDKDTDYNSDSADVTDEEMPPLIDAHQQTMMYFDNEEALPLDNSMLTSQIQESNSFLNSNPNDEEQDHDAAEDKKEDDKRHSVVFSDEVSATPKIEGNLAPDIQPIEKMLSNTSSPNLTPSASQQMLQQQRSASVNSSHSRKRHHRKNSTKTGFWAQNHGKKKPPAGTKAYWLYLDQKASMNGNFANPIRVQSWHHHEIAYWLKQIKCDKYAVAFVDERVSGEQLIHDMNSGVLSTDLGVKMLHCGKIMREIESLKVQAGITFCVEEKVTYNSYKPSDEESVTKRLQQYEEKLAAAEEKHGEELQETESKYDESLVENEKLKSEVETLEKQVVELEKRKAKKADSDDSDSEDDEDVPPEPQPPMQRKSQPLQTVPEVEENGDGDEKPQEVERKEEEAPTLDLPTAKLALKDTASSGKRPKGYFRKYPKEIRKLMREIDGMEKKSNDGTYGEHNVGKFAATRRAFKWKTHEVCFWLDQKGFTSYIHSFYVNGIDGEILVNDLNPTILHEDLAVKRFHTGKMLREIQVLRQGRLYTECENVIDVAYEMQFSASQELEELRTANTRMAEQIADGEQKIEELISRPQIEEHQKIVDGQEWDELLAEKQRLAAQVDGYEEKIDDIRKNALPKKAATEKQEKLQQFLRQLEASRESEERFGDVLRVRQWSTNEVCWFFHSIGLGDYVEGIREEKINGEILIEDTSAELLSRDIGVKRIHINQILRQIDDLKHRAFGYECDDNVIDMVYEPEVYATDLNESYEEKINVLEDENKSQESKYIALDEQYKALDAEKGALSTEKDGLLQNVEALNTKIEELKDAQQLEMEESVKTRIGELQGEIEGLNTRIGENETLYLSEKQEKESETEEILRAKEAAMNELNVTIEELQANLGDANSQISAYVDKERLQREEEEAKDNSYEAQLRRMAQDDATFCVPKRAHKWTIEEVSHWLYTIKVPEYVDTFKEQLVDGSMLLSDLSAEQLRSDLNIKQYHIGKITREIAKLAELATPPLEESDVLCDGGYIPEKPAIELIAELKHELDDQQDINSALNMEVQNLKDQYETIKEIQAMGAAMQQTVGGPVAGPDEEVDAESKSKEELAGNKGTVVSDEELEKLSKENQELNYMLEYLQKSKVDLAVRTADEMQKLRSMVRVASQAYEELTGTPLGKVANWPSTQNFFYNTLGMTPSNKRNY